MASDLTGETVELLQTLIRNECVNDGTPESGFETRNADVLQTYVEGPASTSSDGSRRRAGASFVARIEGTDPAAPTLCLMGHTDVVPVNPAGWRHDPFGGELIDGEVWGRGAVDMLNLTASMAVAFRTSPSAASGPRATCSTSPSPTRRRAAPTGALGRRSAPGRDPLRLRAHRERRSPSRPTGSRRST